MKTPPKLPNAFFVLWYYESIDVDGFELMMKGSRQKAPLKDRSLVKMLPLTIVQYLPPR